MPRLLVPDLPKMRTEVFKLAHCHETAGHFGINATCLRASQKFFWPGMTSALKREVKRCQHCLAKETQVKQRETVHKPRKHGFPGEVLYVDLVGPLPRSDKGSIYVCTMQDGFTKFVTAGLSPIKRQPQRPTPSWRDSSPSLVAQIGYIPTKAQSSRMPCGQICVTACA